MSVTNLLNPNNFDLYGKSLTVDTFNATSLNCNTLNSKTISNTNVLTTNGLNTVSANISNGYITQIQSNTVLTENAQITNASITNAEITKYSFKTHQTLSVPVGGGAATTTILNFYKINDDFAILKVPQTANNNGTDSQSIFTSSGIIPNPYIPASDQYFPVNILLNGVNTIGTLHISTSGFIEWRGNFQANQANGWTETTVLYSLT
jgi:hypothetical protein